MSLHEDQVHSTLEANPHQGADRMKPLPVNPGMQVVGNEGMQFAPDLTGMEATIGSETVINDGYGALSTGSHLQAKAIRPAKLMRTPDFGSRTIQAKRWRLIWLTIVILILVAVLASVLGGVLGTRHIKSHSAPELQPSNTSISLPSTRPFQRRITAFSYPENSNTGTRVYVQDDTGQLIEAANSAVNTTWGIKKTGIDGKNGSAIAAAASRPKYPLVKYHLIILTW